MNGYYDITKTVLNTFFYVHPYS